MCRLCEGATREQLVEEARLRIAVHGYTLQGVVGDDIQPWVYTIGLLDGFDHPELVMAGPSTRKCADILTAFANEVRDGERYEVNDRLTAGAVSVTFGAVHHVQYELDTFAFWHECRNAGVIRAAQPSALQVKLSDNWFCSDHRGTQPVLSDPESRVGLPLRRPNRAERRRRKRT
jgi:hypothetical protein